MEASEFVVGNTDLVLTIFEKDKDAAKIAEGEHRVCDREDKAAGDDAIGEKADRCGELPDEEPFGHALVRAGLPLLAHLHENRDQQNYGASPPDRLRHFFPSFFAFSASAFSCLISTRNLR
jgi:hypothetical protein